MADRDPINFPAVRINNTVFHAPRPDDDEDMAHMIHMDAAMHAIHTGAVSHHDADRDLRNPENLGFVTRSGRYLSRREAVPHILAHDQFRIKNTKDSQLIQLKTKLQRQLAENHPDPSLDSLDIDFFAKSRLMQKSHTRQQRRKRLSQIFADQAVSKREEAELDYLRDDQEREEMTKSLNDFAAGARRAMDKVMGPPRTSTGLRLDHDRTAKYAHATEHYFHVKSPTGDPLAHVQVTDKIDPWTKKPVQQVTMVGYGKTGGSRERLGPTGLKDVARLVAERFPHARFDYVRPKAGPRAAGRQQQAEAGAEPAQARKATAEAQLRAAGINPVASKKHSREEALNLHKAITDLEALAKAKPFWEKEDDDPRETKISPKVKQAALKKFGKWSAVAASWAARKQRSLKKSEASHYERSAGSRFDLLKAGIIVDPMPLKKLGTLFDYESLGKNPGAKTQSKLARVPVPDRAVSAKNYDMTVDQTTKTLRSSDNQRLLDEGMKHHGHLWYHMDPLHDAFKERHGEAEGSKRFNMFMDTIAATSPNSEFSQNMRRAGALFPFMVHGAKDRVLTSEEGLNHLLAAGNGNTAHRNYASALQNIRDNKPLLFSKPLKAQGFSENLRGNFDPLTADRHFLRQAGHSSSVAGPTAYLGVEDATVAHAANLATQGSLPVHSGRSATAPYQSALWIGDALRGRVKSPPHPALAVFEHEIHRTAQRMDIHPKEALHRFMDGKLHEFGGGAPGLKEHIMKALAGAATTSPRRVASRILKALASAEFRVNTPEALAPELVKAQYFQRTVRWTGGSSPTTAQGGDDGNMTTTVTRAGRVARVTTGAVKTDKTPEAKRSKLKRRVMLLDAEDVKNGKDTPTAKYTPMADGKVAKIQFFVKSLAAFRRLLR